MGVVLVSAGPGNRGLLTVRGAEALQQAEIVVYDRLVGQEILEMIPATAEKINVGKRSSHHLVPQEQINAILVEKGLEGKQVVRLKGGDSYLFGRGGEEAEALVAAGVPFEVVPGVTSALAVPAFAGIPVTHRDFCSSVHIITAHARAGGELQIDFEGLIRIGGTLVFLMGVTALPFLMQGLLQAGMSPETPAAVIENGTRYNQRKLVANIKELAEQAQAMQLKSPAIILVGKVCALSDTLDFWGNMPLRNRQIVVTRPRERAGTLATRLRALGAGVLEYPCIDTQELPNNQTLQAAIKELSQYQWVALTSPAGPAAMLHALEAAGKDLRALHGMKIAVIGKGTADALGKYGIHAEYMPECFDARHLAEGLCQQMQPSERVLLLRAAQGTQELPKILEMQGIAYADIPVYETHYRSVSSEIVQTEIAAGRVDVVTFTSMSTVHAFMQATKEVDVSKFTALCIGESTEKAAKSYHMHCKTAKNATIDEMIACLLEE